MDNYEFCARFATILSSGKSSRVLDYGCGAGRTVQILRERGYDAFGCSIFYGGGSAKRQVRPEHLEGGIVREMCDGRAPFPATTFDLVLADQVLEHVPDLEGTLADVARVLKPGGVFLALFPDHGTWGEDHCGVPFLHWFPKRSRPRV